MATVAASRAFTAWKDKFEKAHKAPIIKATDMAAYKVIPTGSLLLDVALGVGGYVEGRLVEIWGADALGKTTLSLLGAASAQKAHPDKLVAFIDMEQTFDKGLADGLGVDCEALQLFTPDSAEAVADAIKDMIRSGYFSMIILDSIGAMIPEVEKTKDADEAVVAAQAKIVTRMVKIAAVEAAKTGVVVILINQVRANVGGYGAATQSPGGYTLRHVTTHKIQIGRTGTEAYKIKVDGEDRIVGHELVLKVERNKVAPPGRRATVNLFNQASEKYGPRGLDRADEAAQLGLRPEVGHIIRKGAWYVLASTGEQVQGLDAMRELLRANPDEVERIRIAAVAAVSHTIVPEEVEHEEADADEGSE